MNTDIKITDHREYFSGLFRDRKTEITGGSSEYMNSVRVKAMDSFRETGLPGKKDERYKYTPVAELYSKESIHLFSPEKKEIDVKNIFRCDIPELDTYVILVINGHYYDPGKEITKLGNGIIYGSLKAAGNRFPELFSRHYARYANFENDGLTALNTVFARDGVFIHIPENVTADKPFQIIHLLTSDEPLMVHHRDLIVLEKNASARVLVCDHTLTGQEYLTNSVTEIFAAENTGLDLIRVQNENADSVQLSATYIGQSGNSRVSTNYITLNGGNVRNAVHVNLAGEGADNKAFGLYLTDGKQHVDNFTNVNHISPNCTSNQLYKGILDDNSTGSFNGKIHVMKDAQHTQAYQRNNNILLSDSAKMNTRPQLEIYADDVKCSHGATVGQLDTDALFYLRSRGIPYKESLLLLMYAFSHSVVSEIQMLPLREQIAELVDKRLRGELTQCSTCNTKLR
jgi:Fe-S cluster assembly protein SufD